jgi:hypothetical protein
MSGAQLVLAHASKIAMLVLLAGVIWRGRVTHCWGFSAYIAAALIGNTLSSVWPGHFFTPSFWMLKQAVYDALKVVIGVEIACRALASFPGTWRLARVVFAVLLVATTGALAWVTPRATYETMWRWHPSVLTVAVWPLTVTALIVTWYRLPIGAWPRRIMLGLAPYLLWQVLLRLLQRHGLNFEWNGVADSVAWVVLMSFWAWAAWRRDAPPDARPLELAVADA